jgi:probable HAF family extracellular repeat protein
MNHGFLQQKAGAVSTIDVPASTGTLTNALGINDRGEIVGTFQDPAGLTHGFLRHKTGAFRTIDVPASKGTFTNALGINSGGDIVGYFKDKAGTLHGFLRDEEGDFRTIDVPNKTAGPAVSSPSRLAAHLGR